MTLTGGVQVSDAAACCGEPGGAGPGFGRLGGNRAVKVDYVQSATGRSGAAGAGAARGASESESDRGSQQGAQPTHILAERAELEYATKVATFHGSSGKPVRLWRGRTRCRRR